MCRSVPAALLGTLLCVLLGGCHVRETAPADPIKISAVELHTAYAADARAAEKRFAGKPLVITGEVKMATPTTTGHTMSGQVTVPAQVYFKTEIDNIQSDIKYVVCEGSFDVPGPDSRLVLNSKIKVGEMLTVKCESAKIRWTDPGLYISNCSLVPQ